MPMILKPEDYDLWLDPEVKDPDMLNPLLRSYPSEEMLAGAGKRIGVNLRLRCFRVRHSGGSRNPVFSL